MSFKNTQVGRIPSEWEVKEIQEIGEVISGGTPKTKEPLYWDGNISWITPKDLSNFNERYIDKGERSITNEGLDKSSAKLLPKGTVLFSSRAPIGYVAIAKNALTTNQGFKNIVCNESKMNNIFLYYMMKYKKHNIENIAGGSTFKEVSGKVIKEFKIQVPPIEEQEAIANILSILDDKIEVNNKINQKLEEMVQAIFKQWFIDFDFPNEEGKPYKSSGGEIVESELCMIPKGWKVDCLSNIANYLNGLAMQKFRPENEKESLKVLKIKELRQGRVDENSDLCSDKIDTKYIIKDGDIIFSWSGSLLVDIWCGGKCGLNQHLFKVTSDNYSKWFYYLWTKYHLNEFIKIADSKATTMGHIKRSDLDNAKVLIPSREDMEKANQVFDSIIEKIVKCKSEVKKIEKLRDILLPKLMSGEIRVQLDK